MKNVSRSSWRALRPLHCTVNGVPGVAVPEKLASEPSPEKRFTLR